MQNKNSEFFSFSFPEKFIISLHLFRFIFIFIRLNEFIHDDTSEKML